MRTTPVLRFVALTAVLLFVGMPASASATELARDSLYADSGLEIRRDDRVFALFAALNAAGYDYETARGTDPIRTSQFHPLRQKIRAHLASLPAEAVDPVKTFLHDHPAPVGRYLSYVLSLGQAPTFRAPASVSGDLRSVKGFEKVLADFYKAASLQKVYQETAEAHREISHQVMARLDELRPQCREYLRVPATPAEAPDVVLVLNPLDAQGQVSLQLAQGERYVVAGMELESAIAGGIQAQLLYLMGAQAVKAMLNAPDGGEMLARAAQRPTVRLDPQDRAGYVATSVLRPLAFRIVHKDDADYAAQEQQFVAALTGEGYLAAESIVTRLKAFEEGTDKFDPFLKKLLNVFKPAE